MVWRQGQSYSEDLRARVLGPIDGGLAARSAASVFSGQRVVHLQGSDPAADRGGERQLAARAIACDRKQVRPARAGINGTSEGRSCKLAMQKQR
jgi:hypothetical protein